MKILVTGCAGFIGHHVCNKLIKLGHNVIGIDNLNKYYDPALKKNRLKETYRVQKKYRGTFKFIKSDICDRKKTKNIFSRSKFNKVIHLAAQAGVRYSLENPYAYFHSNLLGFGNIMQLTKDFKIPHFVYASSSSVYGLSKTLPFSEKLSDANRPLQIYAASKRSNELIAHAYSHLFKLKTTGLRFFTVYGPWGRPDMALFKFTESIIKNKKIKIFNYGKNIRDFTYIDDITDGIMKTLNNKKQSNFFVSAKYPPIAPGKPNPIAAKPLEVKSL